jgi:hypothetical protein
MASMSIHMPRQIDAISIGDACIDMVLNGRELSATCIPKDVDLVSTNLDLNQCLTNDHSVLRFDPRYELIAEYTCVTAPL